MRTTRVSTILSLLLALARVWNCQAALVAHYELEGSANDSSGNGRHGVFVGVPHWAPGPAGWGRSLECRGDNYVEIRDDPAFDIVQAITLAAWVKVPPGGFTEDWQTIFARGDWSWRLHRNSLAGRNPQSISFHLTGLREGWGADGNVAVTDDEWHHVAGTWDGSRARVYFDGVLDDEQPRTGAIDSAGDDPVTIGAQIHGGQLRRRFIGRIDDVRLYNHALSATEVAGLSASRADASANMLYLVNTPPFDPLTEEPQIPPELTTEDPAGYYVLQLHETADEGRQQTLRNRGVTLYGYIPHNGYLVRMREGVKQALLRTGWVRALVPFHPAFRISPSLILGEEPTRPFRCLNVHAFESVEILRPQIEAVLRETGGQSLSLENANILQVTLPAENATGAVQRIAFISGVKWIEETPRYTLLNDDATQFIKAPDAWNNMQLTGGLTGKGQIIAIADSGLDTGKAQTMHEDIKGRIEDAHLHSWPVRKDMAYGNPNADDGPADERPLQPYEEISKTPLKKNPLPPQEAGHGTHVTGSALGNGYWSSTLAPSKDAIKGTAFEATLVFQAVDQWTLVKPLFTSWPVWRYELSGVPSDLASLFKQAYEDGARIHNNSWGGSALTPGAYGDLSRQVDDFARNHPDMVIVFGAGNEGADVDNDGIVESGSVIPPATAKNCITVGATETKKDYSYGISGNTTYGDLALFLPSSPLYNDHAADNADQVYAGSSRGPAADGRIRPDLVAPGSFILSTRSQKLDAVKDKMWGKPSQDGYSSSFDAHYIFAGGTSMATPLVAGAAALVRQYLMEVRKESSPSAALIKAVLINGADDIGNEDIPNGNEGWGRVNLGESISEAMQYFDVAPGIVKEGQEQEFTFTISSVSQPLKVTLGWTDHPAEVHATKALRNDLDLRLQDPKGTLYYGNNFSMGWSTTQKVPDNKNNVECIYIEKPTVGSYAVRVSGITVPDPCQPYALVLRGDLQALKPPDPGFTIHLSPDERVLPCGAAAKYTVRVYYDFGFSEDVALSVPDANILGGSLISTQIVPSVLTPTTGAPYFSTSELSVFTDEKTPPDQYSVTVNGVDTDAAFISEDDTAELVVRAVDAIAVWQHETPAVTSDGVRWDIWYSLWDNHSGIWWTRTEERAAPIYDKPQDPNVPAPDDLDPAIAFDRSGNAVAVWAQKSGGATVTGYDVWYSRWTPHGFDWGWTEPLPIDVLTGDDTDPAVAVDADGTALAVWVHGDGSQRYVYFSATDDKGLWSVPAPLVPLSNWGSLKEAALPEVAFTSNIQAGSGKHQAIAIWVDRSLPQSPAAWTTHPALHYAIWDGAAWYNSSGPQKTKTVTVIPGATRDPFTGSAPQAIHRIGTSSDKNGHAWVTWSTEDTASYTYPVDIINYARWDGAMWDIQATASKSPVGHPENHGRHPAAAYNMSGTAITAYSCDTLPALSPTKPREIFYFYDQGDPIRGAKGVKGDPCYRPAIAVLPDGNVLAVWWVDQQTSPYLEGEIWFSRSTAPEQYWVKGAQIMEPAGPPYLNDCNPALASPTGSPTMPPASYP